MKLTSLFRMSCLAIGLAMLASCSKDKVVEVKVSNISDIMSDGEMVEVPVEPLLDYLGSEYVYVTDSLLNEIPSQVTYDGKLIFQTTTDPGAESVYYIYSSSTPHDYDSVTVGRVYPERADDIAWENELVGFRAYGPATQGKGEKAFGYDIFFKYPSAEPVLEQLYAPETSPATWQKVDSLRAIDPDLAEEFIKTFSYHIDHGLGMDCYAVGATLGAGVAAIELNDTIQFPWCYEKAEVLDNGPLRFSVRLDFAPVTVDGVGDLTEHRLITLDAGSHLNKCNVWYDGLNSSQTVVAGFPRRDESAAVMDSMTMLAYADPTQGPGNGKALLGIVLDKPAKEMLESSGHIIARSEIAPRDTFSYSWGFAWDKTDIKTLAEWNEYLAKYSKKQNKSISVAYK